MVKDSIDVPKEWEIAAGLIQQEVKTCLVMGKGGSGKTTLCKYLVQKWTESRKCVGYVDSDVGQSTIGPPATVGLKVFHNTETILDQAVPTAIHFVGNISPPGFLLQTLAAVKAMTEESYRQGAEVTIIDTTGFIDGPVARVLKYHKVEMLHPQYIIALQAENETEHLLKGYEKSGQKILRLPCSARASIRSQEERRRYRQEKFKEHFKIAEKVTCSLSKLVFPSCIIGTGQKISRDKLPNNDSLCGLENMYFEKCGTELLVLSDHFGCSLPIAEIKMFFGVSSIIHIATHELKNLLAGLSDKNNNTLGIGTIIDLNISQNQISFFTPVKNCDALSIVHFGALKIEHDGRESEKLRLIRYL
ncbi:MAG: hypothetical protein E3K37_04640 [Candidatus Kuenenia sp.]|nr:hypothetical protein [Candidatus Kuenenia hertensis]